MAPPNKNYCQCSGHLEIFFNGKYLVFGRIEKIGPLTYHTHFEHVDILFLGFFYLFDFLSADTSRCVQNATSSEADDTIRVTNQTTLNIFFKEKWK
jgi:hypothetical protein